MQRSRCSVCINRLDEQDADSTRIPRTLVLACECPYTACVVACIVGDRRVSAEAVWERVAAGDVPRTTLALRHTPALILLDLNLPDIHGSELLRRLKSNPSTAPIPVIVVSADITPHNKIHVYAPGAKGYRVIAVKIEESPEIRILPAQYPASEVYYFKPLKERVPVFQKPFRLLQEIVLNGTPQAQAALRGRETVTIKGSLEYQACDDRQCFNPVSVPLTWTITPRALVTQRPNQAK